MGEYTEVNTSNMKRPTGVENDLFTNRVAIAKMLRQSASAEVSIIVVGYNRLEKNRRCVESILKYTKGVDYELILVDSGSSDGPLSYFRAVQCPNKRVIHITQNLGAAYAYSTIPLYALGEFICMAPNDLIVTENWMRNLLTCIKSDSRIGMVTPLTSNSSNMQSLDFSYQNHEEMQQLAAKFNKSDPRKWEDRMRIVTLGTLIRKEVLLVAGWPIGDVGFFHDFWDDDGAFIVRHLGYRTVVAGDTWICHDHKVRDGEGKNMEEFRRSIEIGRKNFQQKHFSVDAWDDVNNFYIPYLSDMKAPPIKGQAHILGIDVRCGTPILDAKNWLRKQGVFGTELSAFTQDAKYWTDLKTICEGLVLCDREEFLADAFPQNYFDIVMADHPLNQYHEPQKLLNDMFTLCKKGGLIVCRLRNTFSFQEYIHVLGQVDVYDSQFSYHIPLEAVKSELEKVGKVEQIVGVPFAMDAESQKSLKDILPAGLSQEQRETLTSRMLCQDYLLFTRKK